MLGKNLRGDCRHQNKMKIKNNLPNSKFVSHKRLKICLYNNRHPAYSGARGTTQARGQAVVAGATVARSHLPQRNCIEI